MAAGLLLLVATAGGAVAARAAIITIEIDFDAGVERFTTNSTVLCPSGDAFTDFHRGAGNFREAGTFHLNKLLVCEDGSGAFVITVDAAANFVQGQGTTGGWSVVPGSGTGNYEGLKGGGNVVGINSDTPPIDLTDSYYGSVRR
ncbi:MAG TPA: hypothetical protein VFR14_05540 [Candidatus Limnocylindrales bacterium]|nr:hypothetical protein [Candidatus Limnocylindrales bacterium]